MTGINKVTEKMRKKISFHDYALPHGDWPAIKEENEDHLERKIYTLSQEDFDLLNTLYQQRLKRAVPASISEIMSEAIFWFYQSEQKKSDFSN